MNQSNCHIYKNVRLYKDEQHDSSRRAEDKNLNILIAPCWLAAVVVMNQVPSAVHTDGYPYHADIHYILWTSSIYLRFFFFILVWLLLKIFEEQ